MEEREESKSSPWLLFPWSIPTLGNHHGVRVDAGSSDLLQSLDEETSFDDQDTRAVLFPADSDATVLTQFPPYGTSQQRAAYHPDLPPDWLNHLSQLSALSTLSELETAAALSSPNHQNRHAATTICLRLCGRARL